MRHALAFVLLFASVLPALAQLPADGRTSYSRDDRIRIPFELRSGGSATKVVLYYSFDGGPWQEFESSRAGQKREFVFKADRDGPYSFATMTYFQDGSSDPPRKDQLTEQRRVVIDKTPPRILSVRPSVSAQGAPGVEWDVSDDYMDPKGIKLEFRWDGTGRYESIDRNVRFGPRDSRYWQLKASDKMEVRVVATDRAGNSATSDPVMITGRDVERVDTLAKGASDSRPIRDPAVTPAGTPASLHYLNTKMVALNYNAKVGPSGLLKATLYWADEKLDWQKHKEEKGPLPAPPVNGADKQRVIPVGFTFEAPKDGLYHFIVIIENHRETSRAIPKKGDPGDVQVMVDTTRPAVEMPAPRVARNGDFGAAVDIRWKATDANIAPVPIKLEYMALRPDRAGEPGEWKAITPDWIDNTGQYSWSAPSGEAFEFLIRVTCKDRAGNEGRAESLKPVNIDLERPSVGGVDVAPARGGNPGGGASSVPPIPDISVGPAPAKVK